MANHSPNRTDQLYDRRSDQISLDEIEPVQIWGRLKRPAAKSVNGSGGAGRRVGAKNSRVHAVQSRRWPFVETI